MAHQYAMFNGSARRVLYIANEAAAQTHHASIEIGHIAFALADERDGILGQVFGYFEFDRTKFEAAIRDYFIRDYFFNHPSPLKEATAPIDLTDGAKKVIQQTVEEAKKLRHNYCGAEHIFLGLVQVAEGEIAALLEAQGVNLQNAREAVIKAVNQKEQDEGQKEIGLQKLRELEAKAKEIQAQLDTIIEERNKLRRKLFGS